MPTTPDLLGRRLLWFTGKGGVGKSTVAAAMALLAADSGKRVLVVDVDAQGSVTELFEHRPVGFKPVEVHPGVFVMTMHTEESLQEYLRVNLRVPVLGRIGPLARALDFVASAAPGVKEILTVGKICWEVREALEGRADWDLVCVDAAATGHVVAQLGAPDAIREFVTSGPVRAQTEWMSQILSDPDLTALNVVSTPEEMPVNETIELVDRVRRELTVPLGAVVVNRVLPELFTTADEAAFAAMRAPAATDALTAETAAGDGAVDVLDAAALAVSLRRTSAGHLARLRREVDLPALYRPYLFARRRGRRVVRVLADALGAELGL